MERVYPCKTAGGTSSLLCRQKFLYITWLGPRSWYFLLIYLIHLFLFFLPSDVFGVHALMFSESINAHEVQKLFVAALLVTQYKICLFIWFANYSFSHLLFIFTFMLVLGPWSCICWVPRWRENQDGALSCFSISTAQGWTLFNQSSFQHWIIEHS